ncbi:MAG: hypothetical protein ACRD2R_00670, partial [Terriglobales bacterium]
MSKRDAAPTPDRKPIFVNGGNGGRAADTQAGEETRARDLARRYRSEFVDLRDYHVQHDLFRTIPV